LFANVGDTLTLLGIASFVGKCGASPSGFTATSHFQQFIDKVSENVGCRSPLSFYSHHVWSSFCTNY
jgi:hypothetical protein